MSQIYKVTDEFGQVTFGWGMREANPGEFPEGIKQVLLVPQLDGFENSYATLGLTGTEILEKMGNEGIIIWWVKDRKDPGFGRWFYSSRQAHAVKQGIELYYGDRFKDEIQLEVETQLVLETPDSCQEVKVGGSRLEYQFNSRSMGTRTFKRKVVQLSYDDFGDGPYIQGVARVLRRNVLVVRDDSIMPWLGVELA